MTRRLIVTADDFGQSDGINRGVAAAFERGIVTSASLMVRWPGAADAAAYARAHPRLALGLHLDFGEWTWSESGWRALYEVPGDPEEVIPEQLERFRELVGRDPTHLDSHQHAHLRDPVRGVAGRVAAGLGVPLRSRGGPIRYSGSFYGQGGKGEPYPESVTVESLIALIDALPEGTTELGCHPGLPPHVESMYGAERELEVATLCDPRVREALHAAGVELCSFAEL